LLHRHAARRTNQHLQVLPHRCWLTSIITCESVPVSKYLQGLS
jgi:hypothetical protein